MGELSLLWRFFVGRPVAARKGLRDEGYEVSLEGLGRGLVAGAVGWQQESGYRHLCFSR